MKKKILQAHLIRFLQPSVQVQHVIVGSLITILTPSTGVRSTRYVNILGSSIFPGSLSISLTTDIGTFSCPFDISILRIFPSGA